MARQQCFKYIENNTNIESFKTEKQIWKQKTALFIHGVAGPQRVQTNDMKITISG